MTDRKAIIRTEVREEPTAHEIFTFCNACCVITDVVAQIEAYLAASLPAADEEEPEEDESGQQPAKKQKRSGAGLGNILSPAMQAFLGCETLPRPQVGALLCTPPHATRLAA